MERQQWQQRVEASLVLVSCPRALARLGQNTAAARCTCIRYPCYWMQRCRCWRRRRRARCVLSTQKDATCCSEVEKHEISNSDEAKELLPRLGFVLSHPRSEYTMQQRCILGLMPPPHAFQMRPVSVLFAAEEAPTLVEAFKHAGNLSCWDSSGICSAVLGLT